MNRKEEIEARLAAIRTEMDDEGADIDALTNEVRGLKAELEKIEKRAALVREVSGGGGTVVRTFREPDVPEAFGAETEEYRVTWLKNLQGKELTAAEQRAFTASNGAISQLVVNDIMSVVRDHAPLTERITVVPSESQITYYVEGTTNDAQDHTENATITPAADTVTKITLTPAEIVKLVQISEAAKRMSIPAFNTWLSRTLGEAIARKINAKIVTAISTAASSSGTAIDAAGIQKLLGSVKGESVALLVNRMTLFVKLLPLQDNSKSSIVKFDGGNRAYVYGTEVLVDDNVAANTVLAGDMKKVIGAMGETISVRSGDDLDTNSTKYLGVALFDVKVGIASAFAKLVASE